MTADASQEILTVAWSGGLSIDAGYIHYPSPVSVRQSWLLHHLRRCCSAGIQDSCCVDTHCGRPGRLWKTPNGLWVVDFRCNPRSIDNADVFR